MSIVAVHGPATFGSQAIIANSTGTAYATVDPANGLIWTLRPQDTSQVAANYDWVYTGSGSPASPQANTMNPVITFAAGAHTVTLTLNSVAQATFVINAVAGTGPTSGLMMAPPDEGGELEQQPSEQQASDQQTSELGVGFDPAAHTVDEVKAYADEHPDEIEELLEAEQAGKARLTLITYLEDLAPYDPAKYSVSEVVEYAEANPELVDDLIEAEEAGKNRSTLLSQLEGLRTA